MADLMEVAERSTAIAAPSDDPAPAGGVDAIFPSEARPHRPQPRAPYAGL